MGVVGFIFAVIWLACGRHHVSSGISAGDSASGGSKIKTASRYEYFSARGELGDNSDARRPSKGFQQSIGGGRGGGGHPVSATKPICVRIVLWSPM